MSVNNNWMRNYVRYSSILLQTIVMIIGTIVVGHRLDVWLKLQTPIFLLIFTIVFSPLSLYLAYKKLVDKNNLE